MSNYLNIYLIPKRKDKKEKKQYLLLNSYSRNSDVYEAFYENMHLVFSWDRDKYTTITLVDIKNIQEDLNKSIHNTQKRLTEYKKYAHNNPEYIEDILSMKEVLEDYQNTYNIVYSIGDIVQETVNGYNDFEEICCNIN